jgi:hypothetical protein
LNYYEAVTAVAAVIENRERSVIGDPRQGIYKVSLTTGNMKEAMQFAKDLARLGIVPTTTIEHDQFGGPTWANVNVYTNSDQKALLDAVGPLLKPRRRQELTDLVLARGPITNDLLERIVNARTRGMSPQKIAGKLNELGEIAGMGGIRWTAKKVSRALAEHQRRLEDGEEAA